MKMHSRYRPEKCVAEYEDRPRFAEPYLDVEAGRVVATDGHMLVAVPVEIEPGDKTGRLGGSVLERARHGLDDDSDKPFPDWRKPLPSFREGDPGTATVGLNAEYLKRIAEALDAYGSGGVVITFRLHPGSTIATEEAIIVRRAYNSDRDEEYAGEIAALMPVRVDFGDLP